MGMPTHIKRNYGENKGGEETTPTNDFKSTKSWTGDKVL